MEAAFALQLTRSAYLALPADDRAWHEAFLAEKRDTHEPCGQPMSESFDAANAEKYRVDPGIPCHACVALAMRSKGDPPDLSYHVHLLR